MEGVQEASTALLPAKTERRTTRDERTGAGARRTRHRLRPRCGPFLRHPLGLVQPDGAPLTGAAPVRALGMLLSKNLVKPKAGFLTYRKRVRQAEAPVEQGVSGSAPKGAAQSAPAAAMKASRAAEETVARSGEVAAVFIVASHPPRPEVVVHRELGVTSRSPWAMPSRQRGLCQKEPWSWLRLLGAPEAGAGRP